MERRSTVSELGRMVGRYLEPVVSIRLGECFARTYSVKRVFLPFGSRRANIYGHLAIATFAISMGIDSKYASDERPVVLESQTEIHETYSPRPHPNSLIPGDEESEDK